MAIREIIFPDNPILRRKANKVRTFDGELHRLIDDMAETMLAAPGQGLAAPQVAVSWRVIVVRLPDDEESQEEYGEEAGKLYEVVNPEIAKVSEEMEDGIEACLSIPGYFGRVERHTAATVKGKNRHGKDIRIKAKGWLARVFQHEIDHLDGVLYIDRATEVWQVGARPEAEETPDETTQDVSLR
jgi:peptide deformylase